MTYNQYENAIVLSVSDKWLVTKFSEAWEVRNNDNIDFTDHAVYGPLIWQLADSVQISDGKQTLKAWGAHGSFWDLAYGDKWRIVTLFIPEKSFKKSDKNV